MRWPVAAILVLAVLVAASLPGCSGSQSRTSTGPSHGTGWPDNYTSWTRLNDAPIFLETEKAARNVYANAAAQARLATGSGPYPVGSVLVKEERLLEANPQGRLRVGDVFRVSVMFKVGRDETSGWAFRAFDPQTHREFPREKVDPDGCYFCHADASARDYVFSRIR
jgi:hypothetical protein